LDFALKAGVKAMGLEFGASELEFEHQGWDLGLWARTWILKIGLGLEVRIWAFRLGFGPQG